MPRLLLKFNSSLGIRSFRLQHHYHQLSSRARLPAPLTSFCSGILLYQLQLSALNHQYQHHFIILDLAFYQLLLPLSSRLLLIFIFSQLLSPSRLPALASTQLTPPPSSRVFPALASSQLSPFFCSRFISAATFFSFYLPMDNQIISTVSYIYLIYYIYSVANIYRRWPKFKIYSYPSYQSLQIALQLSMHYLKQGYRRFNEK